MSGSNPFRRSQKIAEIPNVAAPSTNVYDDDEATAAGRRFPPLNIEVVPSTSRQKTKTVRIASPPAGTPISPESFPSEPPSPVYTRRVGQSGSPPLPDSDSSSSDESVPKDPFAAADSEPNEIAAEEEVLRNTRRNSALSAEDSSEEHKSDTDTVRRTLAKFSPRPQRAQPREEVNTHGGGAQRASRPKQQLDVDAFKRLLLTGNSATAISADGVSISSAGLSLSQLSESGSNTDTASTSRQSIFETLAPPATDIPRSSQTEETGAESQRLGSHDERKKPPPPKTRHGKLIKNDPSLTSPKKVVDNEIDPIVREQTLEDSGTTALDKPLPSPPNEQHTTLSQNVHVEPLLSSPKIPRRPPTPPVTRRQSQRESGKPDMRFNQSTESFPQLSQTSPLATPSFESSASPAAMRTPPVPPIRRTKRSGSTTSSLNQAAVTDSSTPPVPGNDAIVEEPSRIAGQPSSLPPLARSMSGSSSMSTKRLSRPSGVSMGMAPPPPPPPPPRRGRESSRSSTDSQRPSAQILSDAGMAINSSRRTSGDSTRNVSGSSQANTTDILADLAALQREVDQLRQKQKHEP